MLWKAERGTTRDPRDLGTLKLAAVSVMSVDARKTWHTITQSTA